MAGEAIVAKKETENCSHKEFLHVIPPTQSDTNRKLTCPLLCSEIVGMRGGLSSYKTAQRHNRYAIGEREKDEGLMRSETDT